MRLTVEDPSKLFFTGDHHFGHDKIRKYTRRPFASVHEMNKELVERWNAVVPVVDGQVIHVGDFMMSKDVDHIQKMRRRLNGTIVLVRGNHDPKDSHVFSRDRDPLKHAFDAVCDLLYLSVREGEGKYRSIMVSHFAMRVWHKSHFNEWHVYGHSHGGLEPYGKSYDVGVDNNDYTPVAYADLRDIMAQLPNNPNLVER